MAGMVDEIIARQRLEELLRQAEEQRCGASLSTERSRDRTLLDRLLGGSRGRFRRGRRSGEDREIGA
jgi:hypothetical protein